MAAPRKSVSLLTRALRPWWRLTRGLTLGAQGVILTPDNTVLLVRHGYRPGWFFPGGGVERNESLETALSREVEEETGVVVTGRPEFHGLFANIENFPGDHIGVFVIRLWERKREPKANAEIAEQGFFAPDSLPKGIDQGTRRRLTEILDGQTPDQHW